MVHIKLNGPKPQRSPGFFGTPPPGAHGTPQGAAQTGLQWRPKKGRQFTYCRW